MIDFGEGDPIEDQLLDAAMASQGAVTYNELMNMPLSEMYRVFKRISHNCEV